MPSFSAGPEQCTATRTFRELTIAGGCGGQFRQAARRSSGPRCAAGRAFVGDSAVEDGGQGNPGPVPGTAGRPRTESAVLPPPEVLVLEPLDRAEEVDLLGDRVAVDPEEVGLGVVLAVHQPPTDSISRMARCRMASQKRRQGSATR